MPAALDRLTGDADTFRKAWPDTPAVYERDRGDLAELLDLDAVRRIVADPGLRPIEMGMVRGGTIDPRRPDADDRASTLVLNGLHITWPPLVAFCQQLAAELGHPVTGNAYSTPAHAHGYGPHWDTHHVFLAQTDGAKVWRLSRPVFTDPLERHRWTAIGFTDEQLTRATDEPDMEIELSAGQVLFIPRGWVHHGHTTDRRSLHITFGVQLLTRFWLVQQLLAHVTADPYLRAALPPNLSNEDMEALIAQTGQGLADRLAALDPQAPAAAVRTAQQFSVLGVK
ncbi:cupin domain-containing protein [Streptomyces sp. PH10-H1]|uniref:JmjC domain-containing protein n=1 Tax=Streptomyces sp. PH10-H1 TaxID=3046212 RepID=UPI0024BBC6B7|nr:cupin domain-containing protein [Streptomyces sp. PH10-H1]MDJ0346735.1 cupin domain-containing protein [Streptomyces sp. PH10-H1]